MLCSLPLLMLLLPSSIFSLTHWSDAILLAYFQHNVLFQFYSTVVSSFMCSLPTSASSSTSLPWASSLAAIFASSSAWAWTTFSSTLTLEFSTIFSHSAFSATFLTVQFYPSCLAIDPPIICNTDKHCGLCQGRRWFIEMSWVMKKCNSSRVKLFEL